MDQNLVEDSLRIGGVVTVEVIRDGKNGPEVIERRQMHNLVVNIGKRQLLRLGSGLQTKFYDQFRIGTSPAAAAVGQSNVLAPVAGTLITADSKTFISITTGHEWVISYPSGGGSISANGIAEVVLLNENTSPGGSALMRSLITPTVNKTTLDKLKITYQLKVT